MSDIVNIVGVASGYSWDVVETAHRAQREVRCVDNFGGADSELPNLVAESDLTDRSGEFVLGIGTATVRGPAAHAAAAAGWTNPTSLVDPTSVVATSTEVRHGAFVNAAVVVGAKSRIGCFANLNRGASVAHHVTLGAFAHVGPSATITGNVTLGAGAFIGAGAVVLPGIAIGDGAIVGAGSVVTRDVPAFTVVVGNPARHLKDTERWDATCPYCETN